VILDDKPAEKTSSFPRFSPFSALGAREREREREEGRESRPDQVLSLSLLL